MNTILIPNELKDDEGYLLSVCAQMVIDSLVGEHKQFHNLNISKRRWRE